MIIQGIGSFAAPRLASVFLNQWALSLPAKPLLLHAHLDNGIAVAAHGQTADLLVHFDRFGFRDRIGQCRGWMDEPHNSFVKYARSKGLPVDGPSTRRSYIGMMLDELSCGTYPEAVVVWMKPLSDPLAIRVEDIVEHLHKIGIATVRIEQDRSITIEPGKPGFSQLSWNPGQLSRGTR